MAFLTKDDEEGIIELHNLGENPTRIAEMLAIPRSTIRGFIARKFSEVAKKQAKVLEGVGVGESILREADTFQQGVLDMQLRPLSVPVPTPQTLAPSSDGVITAVLYGDTHFPSHDEPSLKIVAAIASQLQPHLLAHMGDLLDSYELSRFDKNPNRKNDIQDEINMARQHLATMRLLCPDSKMVLIEGNHEDRLRRLLWNLPSEAKVLSKITAFQEAMTWPSLLGLDELFIEHIPYGREHTFKLFPGFMLKHGHIVRQKSGYSAHGEYDRWRQSGASGHTHRLAAYYHDDDVWVETGCTCKLQADYTPYCNWQNGLVVLTVSPNGATTVEPVKIKDGEAVFRGQVYRA